MPLRWIWFWCCPWHLCASRSAITPASGENQGANHQHSSNLFSYKVAISNQTICTIVSAHSVALSERIRSLRGASLPSNLLTFRNSTLNAAGNGSPAAVVKSILLNQGALCAASAWDDGRSLFRSKTAVARVCFFAVSSLFIESLHSERMIPLHLSLTFCARPHLPHVPGHAEIQRNPAFG